jgi:hypothetical protein
VNVEIKEFLYRNFFTARRRRAEGGTVHCEVRCMVCGRNGSFVHPQAVHYYEHMLMCFNSSDAKKILQWVQESGSSFDMEVKALAKGELKKVVWMWREKPVHKQWMSDTSGLVFFFHSLSLLVCVCVGCVCVCLQP